MDAIDTKMETLFWSETEPKTKLRGSHCQISRDNRKSNFYRAIDQTIKPQVVKAQLLVRTNCQPVTIPGTIGSRGPTVYVDFIEFYRILSPGQHSPDLIFPGLTQSNSPGQHSPALNFPGLSQSNSPGQHSPVNTSWTHQSIN